MNNDGFDGIVISESVQLVHNFFRIQDHTLEVHHPNFVPEPVDTRLLTASVQRDIHQREHGQHKEEECASPDQDPQPDTRTCIFSHK